jgi:hypothetical protein
MSLIIGHFGGEVRKDVAGLKWGNVLVNRPK